MWTVLLTILVFGAIIAIHEAGHFIAAKSCGVKVNQFALGMGPKLFSFQKGETLYALRLLPIGGFVSMEGEDEDSSDHRAFCNQALWKRMIIVCAGAFMNLILGLLVLYGVYGCQERIATNRVAEFRENSVSDSYGLQAGDDILKINGKTIYTENDIVSILFSSNSATAEFTVKRDGEKLSFPVTFTTQPGEEKDSLYLDFLVQSEENSIWNTLSYATRKAVSLGRLVWMSLVDLISGNVGFDQLSGPVGVGQVIGQTLSVDLQSFFILVAFLTINVGIFNLIPFPALDGGRLLFMIIELIFRKPVPAKYESYVHAVGMILLFGLMIAVTFKDVVRVFFA